MNTKETILSTLRNLTPVLKRDYHVESLSLFGSISRNKPHPESDIDLLVDFRAEATLFDLVGLGLFLEDQLQQKVDIVPQESLRAEIKDTVLQELIRI
jgi:uncharacterized protein